MFTSLNTTMTTTFVALHSKAFPGKYLSMNATGVNQFTAPGSGLVSTANSIGPNETFIFERFNTGAVSFKSSVVDNVYLRLDGSAVPQGQDLPDGGGVVNCQFGNVTAEKFRIVQQSEAPNTYDGAVGIESNQFSGRFLRMNGLENLVNVQGVFLQYEQWQILVIGQ